MSKTAHFIAADLGASSGRITLGEWDGGRFTARELHRFANRGVLAAGTLYWDILGLWQEMQAGLRRYHTAFGETPQGVAVDAWGVDFGLLDRCGRLIANPVHYRDRRTEGMPAEVFKLIPEREWFRETGVQTMAINTVFQLFSMVRAHDPAFGSAQTLLMIPDLFTWLLCGEAGVEWTEASTTQMFSPVRNDWARGLLRLAGIQSDLLPPVTRPGTVLSGLRSEVREECGFTRSLPAIAVASHDTASAVAAIPRMDAESVFLSSGTWSLMGIETKAPVTADTAFRRGFTNEGGAGGSTLLLKNLTGLWILQECLRQWASQNCEPAWDDLVAAAVAAPAFRSLIHPDAPEFQAACDMPRAIGAYCSATGQPAPETQGQFARCAFESLSLNYRSVLDSLRALTGRDLSTIRVVGGGGRNGLLCELTADACGCEVVSGPAEASTLGNVMVQAIATGHLADLHQGREAMAASVECTHYAPRPSDRWREAYARFLALPRDGARSAQQHDLQSAAAVS